MEVIPDVPHGLNKTRVEALSDGVFSIAMTILVFDIKLPASLAGAHGEKIIQQLMDQGPLFLSYFVSFTVLSMFWTTHNALFHFFSKTVNRLLIQLNMLYLAFIVLVPFSANFVGLHPTSKVALGVYGVNIFLIGLLMFVMFTYSRYAHDIDGGQVSERIIKQAHIRIVLPPLFAIIGLLSLFIYPQLSLFCFAFPVIFNIVPGTLDHIERFLGVKL